MYVVPNSADLSVSFDLLLGSSIFGILLALFDPCLLIHQIACIFFVLCAAVSSWALLLVGHTTRPFSSCRVLSGDC